MKKKNVQVLILTILCGAFSVWGLTALVRHRDTRRISAQLSAAIAQIKKGRRELTARWLSLRR